MTQGPVSYQAPPPGGAGRPAGLGIASMVMGIVSFGLCFVPIPYIGWAGAILAIVLGFAARAKVKAGTGGGGGFAITGIVLGFVWIGIAVLALAGISFLGSWAGKNAGNIQNELDKLKTQMATQPSSLFRFHLQSLFYNVRSLIH